MYSLDFERVKKAFHHGVVIAVSFSGHALDQAMLLDDLRILGAGILTASI